MLEYFNHRLIDGDDLFGDRLSDVLVDWLMDALIGKRDDDLGWWTVVSFSDGLLA